MINADMTELFYFALGGFCFFAVYAIRMMSGRPSRWRWLIVALLLPWIVAGLLFLNDYARKAPFFAAVKNGNLPKAEALLAENPRLLNSSSSSVHFMVSTPLTTAVRANQLEMAAWLLQRDADPDKSDPDAPPLHHAAQLGYADLLQLLVDHGADIEGPGFRHNGPPIHAAAALRHVEVIDLLVTLGADVDGRDDYSETALMAAAWEGETASVAALLRLGANARAENSNGQSALSMARRWKHGGIVRLLEAAGAKR